MDGMLEWGYDLIEWAQQFSPMLDTLFKAITTLGAEQAFLLLSPLIFWCVDKRRGVRLGVLLMFLFYVNHALKLLFDQPRPSPDRVQVMAEEFDPGLPSGHAQSAVMVYGFLAAQVRRPWAWGLAALIALSVGLSRIYMGLHFPTDVLAGWLIGIVMLAFYLRVEPPVERRFRAWPWNYQMLLAFVVPLALFLVYFDAVGAQLMGTLLGLLVGVLIEFRWVRFSAKGPRQQRAARFVFGSAILVAIWLGAKAIFPTVDPYEPETVALIFRLIRYALVGVWTSLGAPWCFVRMKLAASEG